MRSSAKLALLVPLGAAAAMFACARDAEVEQMPPESTVLDGGSEPGDASDAADTAVMAPCSPSGLCIVPAPINTRINITSISGSGAKDVWAVGTARTLLHYDGVVWEKGEIEEDAAAFTMRAVWASGPSDVWIADGPAILHSTGWRGPSATTWESAVLDGPAAAPSAISGKSGKVIIGRQLANDLSPDLPGVVVCSGWGDGGLLQPEYPENNPFGGGGTDGLWAIAMTRTDEAWATSIPTTDDRPGARVLRVGRAIADAGQGNDDERAPWRVEDFDSRTGKHLYGVWGDEQAVWLVGEGGAVRRMTPANAEARAFEVIASPTTAALRGIHGFAPDDVWAVGDDATVIHWDGTSWKKVSSPFDGVKDKPRLFSVWGSGPNDIWIGGNGFMLHLEGDAR